jgi:hypothetical protein
MVITMGTAAVLVGFWWYCGCALVVMYTGHGGDVGGAPDGYRSLTQSLNSEPSRDDTKLHIA